MGKEEQKQQTYDQDTPMTSAVALVEMQTQTQTNPKLGDLSNATMTASTLAIHRPLMTIQVPQQGVLSPRAQQQALSAEKTSGKPLVGGDTGSDGENSELISPARSPLAVPVCHTKSRAGSISSTPVGSPRALSLPKPMMQLVP